MNSIEASYKPDATGQAPKQMKFIPYLKLNDGHEIPMLAYGMGSANYKKGRDALKTIDKKIIADTVMAIKAGFFHLDGADGYGNETELGRAIKEAGVARENLYVVTKTSNPSGDRTIEEDFSASLEKLGLDYVDLYLIHSPFFADGSPGLLQAKWAEMEAIRASGRARSIGVSNFLQRHLEVVLQTAKVPPALNQIEFHPYLQHGDLLAFHRERAIAVSAYGALTPVTRARPGPLDDVYPGLAKKYGVSEGEVALRWVLDQGVIAVTTSAREERLKSYLTKLPAIKLTPKEVQLISEEGRKKHYRSFWSGKYKRDDRS